MLTTRRATGLRARPLEVRPDRAAGLIWFVTDLRGAKEHEIAAEHDVGLVFIDKDESAYLPITARGDVRRDWAEAAAIWKATDNMWWDGPDDPNAGVICVTLLMAELWDGPASKAVTVFDKPHLGENRSAIVDMR